MTSVYFVLQTTVFGLLDSPFKAVRILYTVPKTDKIVYFFFIVSKLKENTKPCLVTGFGGGYD